MRDLGYVEGKNLVIEVRWSRTVEQMNEAAAELARMKVDVIFAPFSTEVEAARRATNTIPIIFAVHADPVGVGHVSSLARPGWNMTGLAMLHTGLTEKRLELLKEAVPQATRFGVLWDRTAPSYRPSFKRPRMAFATMAHDHVGGVLVHASQQTTRDNPQPRPNSH